jgi:hypothetical protein
MSSYSLPARYQSYLGANFFQRQISNIADALPGVIKRGLAQSPTVTPPDNAGLPDVSAIDKPKLPYMLYAGLGVGAVLILGLAMKGRKSAPKA